MQRELLNTLVQRKIITQGTKVEAIYKAPGLDTTYREVCTDVFFVEKAFASTCDMKVKYITANRCRDNKPINLLPEHIVKIDGMLPKDVAGAFDILENGQPKKVKLDEFGNPVRRGRKRKHPLPTQQSLNNVVTTPKKRGRPKKIKEA